MEKELLNLLKQNKNKGFTLNDLYDLLKIDVEDIEDFNKILLKNQLSENIIYIDGVYKLFPNDKNLKVGILKHDGTNYYIMDDENKYYINDYDLKNALVNDKVLYFKNLEIPNNASVKSVIYRKQSGYIFDVVKKDGKLALVPYSKDFLRKINIPSNEMKKLHEGERILIELDSSSNYMFGHVTNHIGNKDDFDILIKTIAANYDIETAFPEEEMEEAKKIKNVVNLEEIKERVDLRDKEIFTIDGVDTKDIDDAVSLEEFPTYYLLGVHIADVSHYVKEGSAIYNDAKKRGNSYYPANCVIPMLPKILSNEICSLNPNADRLTITCEMKIDKKGNLFDYNIYESVINSKKKMNYDDVNKILNGEDVLSYEKFKPTLLKMNELHKLLDFKKQQRGYINFSDNDVSTSFKDGTYDYNNVIRYDAEKMIEDFMLTANETVATYMQNMGLNFLYRCHNKPEPEKIKDALMELEQLGYNIKTTKRLDDNYCIQDILKQINELNIEEIASPMILQSMKRAIYSISNVGHFGLGLNSNKNEAYTHFTSPIRRFIDLVVHQMLKKVLHGELEERDIEDLVEISNHCNTTTKKSDEFEREINKVMAIEYLKQNIDAEYTVKINYIFKNYLVVKTPKGIMGKINVNDLPVKYKFDSKNKMLYNNTDVIKIGDNIDVYIKEIDEENYKVSFTTKSNEIKRVKKM